MAIVKKNYKKRLTLLCSGEFTIYEARDILKSLHQDADYSKEEIYLDLSEVTDCDTAGIQILLYIRKLVSQMNKKLILGKSNQTVDELFDLLDLHKFFNQTGAA